MLLFKSHCCKAMHDRAKGPCPISTQDHVDLAQSDEIELDVI